MNQDELYDNWDYGDFPRFKAKIICDMLPRGNPLKLLDVACGYGQFGLIIDREYYDYVGIDFSKEQVKKGKALGLDIRFMDVSKRWKFPSNHFDIILASEILEHVFDTDFFIQECFRVLKDDGILIVSTPNVAELYGRI